MVSVSSAPPDNMAFLRRLPAWGEARTGGRSHTLAASSAAKFPLVRLPPELQSDIFSRLPLHDLAHAELICRGIRPCVLAAWRHEIPKSQRTAIASKTMPVDAWKQAWMGQCKKLETIEAWGAKAAQACKAWPDDLNPFDVETECNKWLAEEKRLGNFQGPKTLEEVFEAFAQNKSELNLGFRDLHSLPPFLDKIKTLQELSLRNNQLVAVDLKDLPKLEMLDMRYNQLVAIDLKDLPELRKLYLANTQLVAIDFRDLPRLEMLYLVNNQLVAIDLKDLPELRRLYLTNNQLVAIDLKDLPELRELSLADNQLAAIDLKGLPELRWLSLSNNQLAAIDLKDLPKLSWLYLEDNQHHLVGSEHRHALQLGVG